MRFRRALRFVLSSHMGFDWVSRIFIVAVMVWCCDGLPTTMHRFKRSPGYDDAHNYLTQYGYLPKLPSSDIADSLRAEDQLQDAIRSLQEFGNIPVTGVLDEETKRLLIRPRCGLPDVQSADSVRRKRYVLHGESWPRTNLTWSLLSYKVQNLDYYKVVDALAKALNVWGKHSKLTFTELYHTNDADIAIRFESKHHGDGFPFDGRGQVLAHAFFPGPGRGGDAHFDDDEQWSVDDVEDRSKGTSLFAVAAHEFGHSLGLSHSKVSGALMFPWYQGLKANLELHDDDKEALQRLYGANTDYNGYPPRRPYAPFTPSEPPYKAPPPTEPPYRRPPSMEPPHRRPTPAEPPYKRPPSTEPPQRRPAPTEPPYRPPPTEPPYRPPYTKYTPRITHQPTTKPVSKVPKTWSPNPDNVPETCDTSYDAITMIRGELFIFKDKYLWRISNDSWHREVFPTLIRGMWPQLPEDLTHVDDVYEQSNHKHIVFLIGRKIYMFFGTELLRGYPKPLTAWGFPPWLDHIDAAMVWGYNSKTYFFSGNLYWRFDDEIDKVDLDYPRNMSIWNGIGTDIDTAFQWINGVTYFFKGKGYWKFNDLKLSVHQKRQTPSAPFWMGCPKTLQDAGVTDNVNQNNSVQVYDLKPDQFIISHQYIILIAIIIIALILVAIIIETIRRRNSHLYIRPKRIGR